MMRPRNNANCADRRSSYSLRSLFAFLFLFVTATVMMYGQAYSGAIVGSVTDTTGAAIVGAKVVVVSTATNQTFNTTSSNIGAFTVTDLPVGVYTVKVTATGFKGFVTNNVEVHVSSNSSVLASLKPGSVSDTVTVQADTVQVETTSAAVGEVISGEQVRELPTNGENFVTFTQLSPGVSAATDFNGVGKGLSGGVNFSVNGNPYTNNLFLVDGVNNNDVGSNRTILVYPSVDTIAEFKMIRNSFGAEYGQASGSIISITTRSGQNQFHGGFFYAGRNDALDANDFFSKNNGTGKGKLRHNDFGYNVSGPVFKDKLFFWWNQEWDKEIRGFSYGSCVPTDAESGGDFSAYGTGTGMDGNGNDQCGAAIPGTSGLNKNGDPFTNPGFPSYVAGYTNPQKLSTVDVGGNLIAQFYPSANYNSNQTMTASSGYNWASAINNNLKWSEMNGRGDFDITKKHRLTARWTNETWDNPAPNWGNSFWGESDFPTVQSTWQQPSKSIMAGLNSQITDSIVNNAEFGYGHNAIITSLAGTRASIVPALDAAYPTSFPASLKEKDGFFGGWGGLNPYGSYNGSSSIWNIAPYANHEDLYTVQDNLSVLKGNHLFKVGAFYSWNVKVEDGGNGADRPGLPGSVFCAQDGGGHDIIPVAGTTPAGTPACVKTNNALANILVQGAATATYPQYFANIGEGSIDATANVVWHDFEWFLTDTWKIRRNLSLELGARWSFYREPTDKYNHWANWDPNLWTASAAAANPGDACNGLVIVPGTDPCGAANTLLGGLGVNLGLSHGTPGPNNSLMPNNNHDIAPRVGLTWDVFGNGRTAVHLGAGQFFQRELVGIDEGLAKGAPFSLNASSNRTIDTPAALGSASVSPNYAKVPTSYTPNSWQWNSTIEQELARNTTLSVGYVGNTGIHLTSMQAFNAVPQSNWAAAVFNSNGTGNNGLRPATNFAGINGFARAGHSTYHSLQVLLKAQKGPSTFQVAYTWSHSIGDVENDNSSGSANQEMITINGTSKLDKGSTNINRPQIFVVNEVYYLPKFQHKNQIIRQTIGGWEINGIFTYAHGNSLTVFTNGGFNNGAISQLIGTGYNGNNRPLTTSVSCNSGESKNHILNANAFTLVGYTLGTIPTNIEHRGYCFGPPTTDLDSQLVKNWYIHEKYRIKFAMDFFDVLNHPNFTGVDGAGFTPSTVSCGGSPCSAANPVITSESATSNFGVATGQQMNKFNRELQYSLKFSF